MLRCLCLFVLLGTATYVAAGDWPQWLGPNRDGTSAEEVKPWTAPPKTLWSVPVGEGHSSPIVADGKVFLHTKIAGEQREQVEAFEAASGKPLWKESYERGAFKNQFGDGPRSTPLCHDGRLYTLGVTGILTCWGVADGKVHWRHDLLKKFNGKNLYFGISTTPLICGDLALVMVGAPGASVVAFDRKSGDVKWQAGDDGATYSSPMKLDEKTAVFLTAKGVRGIEAATGKTLWFQPFVDLLNESSSTPVAGGGKLVVSSVTAGSLCLDLDKLPTAEEDKKKAVAWKDGKLTCYFATPMMDGERLFAVTGSLPPNAAANLHCVELATGKVLWTKKKVGTYHATLLKTKDKMLMLEEGGDLVLFQPDAAEYKELARAKICGNTWAHPALADGKLFIRDAKELRAWN